MNTKIISLLAVVVVAFAVVAVPAQASLLGTKLSAAASLNASSSASTKLDTTAQAKADTEISARITALNTLLTRIGQMQRVSSSDKANLTTTLQSEISQMTALKAKIDSDTSNTTLIPDIQSITKSFRIYVLVLPQGRITAAADRVMTIVTLLDTLSAKLQTRITAAQNAGQNMSAETTLVSDMNAKTADANTQAQAAVSEVSALQPDNGNTTIYNSNQAALKDARSKIAAATADLKTARQDAGSIVKIILSLKISSTVNASSTNQ